MISKSIFDPVKEQFSVLVEYINILDLKKNIDTIQEVILILNLIENIKKQCDIYLNYQLTKQGYANKKL
jgi:hypothetical protein